MVARNLLREVGELVLDFAFTYATVWAFMLMFAYLG